MKRATPPMLDELLDFRPDAGIIRLHDQRVVILSATAMGLLRRQLVDTLGVETARRLPCWRNGVYSTALEATT